MAPRRRDNPKGNPYPKKTGPHLPSGHAGRGTQEWWLMTDDEKRDWVLSRCSDYELGVEMVDRYPEPIGDVDPDVVEAYEATLFDSEAA